MFDFVGKAKWSVRSALLSYMYCGLIKRSYRDAWAELKGKGISKEEAKKKYVEHFLEVSI